MSKKKTRHGIFRLDPSIRMCPNFDYSSMALFPVDESDVVQTKVLDNCAEEHMQ